MADADAAQREVLARLEAAEHELSGLEEMVRNAVSRLRREIASARVDVTELHAAAIAQAPAAPSVTAEPASPEVAAVGSGDDGARLVALDLVMRGVEREQAERDLAAEYPDADVAALLDEAAATLAG
jgi:hypothetical protein